MIQLKSAQRRILFTSLKIVVLVLVLFWFIDYWHSDLKNSKEHLLNANNSYLFLALVLFTFNWFVEAKKWQLLIKKTEKLSLLKSLMSVYSGATASAFIPFKMGSFLGRMIDLKTPFKVRAIPASIVGNLLQLSITILIGSIAFLYWAEKWKNDLSTENIRIFLVLALLFLILLFLGIIYYKRIAQFLNKKFRKVYKRKNWGYFLITQGHYFGKLGDYRLLDISYLRLNTLSFLKHLG